MTSAEQASALAALHAEIASRAAIIGAPSSLLPARAKDGASADGMWIELCWFAANDGDDVDGWWYVLNQNEDGQVFGLAEVMDEGLDRLLYEAFSVVTWRMAERVSTGGGNASRLTEKVRLLRAIDEAWASRALRSIEDSRGATKSI